MVEQGTHKPLVVGSNPSLATSHITKSGGLRLIFAEITGNFCSIKPGIPRLF